MLAKAVAAERWRERADGLPPLYLVKWSALPYDKVTWESACGALRHWPHAIAAFHAREERARRGRVAAASAARHTARASSPVTLHHAEAVLPSSGGSFTGGITC